MIFYFEFIFIEKTVIEISNISCEKYPEHLSEFERLMPHELIVHIFTLCGPKVCGATLSLVSKNFNQLASDSAMWKLFCYQLSLIDIELYDTTKQGFSYYKLYRNFVETAQKNICAFDYTGAECSEEGCCFLAQNHIVFFHSSYGLRVHGYEQRPIELPLATEEKEKSLDEAIGAWTALNESAGNNRVVDLESLRLMILPIFESARSTSFISLIAKAIYWYDHPPTTQQGQSRLIESIKELCSSYKIFLLGLKSNFYPNGRCFDISKKYVVLQIGRIIGVWNWQEQKHVGSFYCSHLTESLVLIGDNLIQFHRLDGAAQNVGLQKIIYDLQTLLSTTENPVSFQRLYFKKISEDTVLSYNHKEILIEQFGHSKRFLKCPVDHSIEAVCYNSESSQLVVLVYSDKFFLNKTFSLCTYQISNLELIDQKTIENFSANGPYTIAYAHRYIWIKAKDSFCRVLLQGPRLSLEVLPLEQIPSQFNWYRYTLSVTDSEDRLFDYNFSENSEMEDDECDDTREPELKKPRTLSK